jgi:hypothetical protein
VCSWRSLVDYLVGGVSVGSAWGLFALHHHVMFDVFPFGWSAAVICSCSFLQSDSGLELAVF